MIDRSEKSPEPENHGKRATWLPLAVYFAVLLVLLFEPFDFGLPSGIWPALQEQVEGYRSDPFSFFVELGESFGHIILFFPLGPLLASWMRLRPRQLLSWKMLLSLIIFSAVLELIQGFVGRGIRFSDFSGNLVGFAAGIAAYWLYESSPVLRRTVQFATTPAGLCVWLGAVLAVIYLSIVSAEKIYLPVRSLGNWEEHYPLSVGNERIGTRPWLGRVERVVIRNRPLSAEDIRKAFENSSGKHPIAAEKDPTMVAAYSFAAEDIELGEDGGVLGVESSTGPLLRTAKSGIYSVPGGGVEFREESILRTSIKPWAKELKSIIESDAFTLEVRFRARDDMQDGLATIVSSSCCPRHLNFVLAQQRDSLEMRMRNIFSTSTSSLPLLRVDNCIEPRRRTDVAVTHSRGTTRIYVDGEERGVRRGKILDWFSAHAFRSAVTGKVIAGMALVAWAFCFLPLWLLIERRGGVMPWSGFCAAGGALALMMLVLWIAG